MLVDGVLIMEPRSMANYSFRTANILSAYTIASNGLKINYPMPLMDFAGKSVTIGNDTFVLDTWEFAPDLSAAPSSRRTSVFTAHDALKKCFSAIVPHYTDTRRPRTLFRRPTYG